MGPPVPRKINTAASESFLVTSPRGQAQVNVSPRNLISGTRNSAEHVKDEKRDVTEKVSSNTEGKRRKRRMTASFDGMEQRVSHNVSLQKLVAVIPGFELDMIDEGHPVEIVCSRVNGKIRIEL